LLLHPAPSTAAALAGKQHQCCQCCRLSRATAVF
jgi:hypothetical protein